MSKFLDLFEPIQKGDFGLTDEAIYKSIQSSTHFIPIWGGNKDHTIPDRMVSVDGKTKSGNKITLFNGEGIILSLDGSSGCMTYKKDLIFALNHHAGFFKVRNSENDSIIPEFFVLFYKSLLSAESISEGSKTLTLGQIYNLEFDIPSFENQQKIMLHLKPLLRKRDNLKLLSDRISKLENKVLSSSYSNYQALNIPISKVIDYMSGNTGLTEYFIYQKLQIKGKKYNVLASSMVDRSLGSISMCSIRNKPLKVFDDIDGLLVIRKGKAGNTRILPKGNYTINEDAYILYVKEDSPFKINLKWLSIQYKEEFLSYSSSSDNGTWNMTGFFKHVTLDIPDYNEQQKVVKIYDRLESYKAKIVTMHDKIESLTSLTIVQS